MVYVCVKCKTVFRRPENFCPICGGLLLSEEHSFFVNSKITLGEGNTPLLWSDALSDKFGVGAIALKDETRNPTGSFVDRGIAQFISYYKDRVEKIICPTMGDTGVSISAYASRAGLEVEIYTTKGIPRIKLYQMLIYGAKVTLVSSNEELNAYLRLSGEKMVVFSETSPLYIGGVESIIFELEEYLERGEINAIVAPVGTGALLLALWSGARFLYKTKRIGRFPKIIGIRPKPISESIMPYELVDIQRKILPIVRRYLNNTGGGIVEIKPTELNEKIMELARLIGLILDPASVIPIYSLELLKKQKLIESKDRIAILLTGSGIKSIEALDQIVSSLMENVHVARKEISMGGLNDTKKAILRVLKEGPIHGYAVREKLKSMGFRLALSTIYGHLKDLVSWGVVERVKAGDKRIYYVLTEQGRKLLENNK